MCPDDDKQLTYKWFNNLTTAILSGGGNYDTTNYNTILPKYKIMHAPSGPLARLEHCLFRNGSIANDRVMSGLVGTERALPLGLDYSTQFSASWYRARDL